MPKTIDRSKRLFSGPSYKSFDEAFPEVEGIRFEYKISPNESGMEGPFVLTKENMVGVVLCPNRLCRDGGFEIDTELSWKVFRDKLQHHEGLVICSGHENMGSRWKTRPCARSLKYKVDVEYKQ